MNKLLKICYIFITTSVALADISQQKIDQAINDIVPVIQDGLKKTKIPGCYFVVTRKGKIVTVKTFGNTVINTNDRVNSHTIFPISSITKNFTAFLVGALVDDGKLEWNAKVRKYCPNFFLHSEELSRELEVKDLISHSSGFSHFAADTLFSSGYSNSQIMNAFKYLKHHNEDFRKHYGYQNVVFGLIKDVIEAATGEKYEDLMQRYIFDKLDMTESSSIPLKYEESRFGHFKYLKSRFSYDSEKNGFFSALWNIIQSIFTFSPKKVVTGHAKYKDEIYSLEKNEIFHVFPATSGIACSANDFAKWVEMVNNEGTYNNKTIVKPETFKVITSKVADIVNLKDTDFTFPINRFSRNNLAYGIGTFILNYDNDGKSNRTIIGHMGGIYGATSFYAVSLEDNLGVGVVTNFGGTSQTLFAEYITCMFMDLCFGFKKIDWVQKEIDRADFFKKKQTEYLEKQMGIPTPAAKLNRYTGKYNSEIYGDITITEKNNKLVLSNGIRSTELEHVNNNIFKFPCRNMMISSFNGDEYIYFYLEKNNFDKCIVSCFSEGDTIFKKVED